MADAGPIFSAVSGNAHHLYTSLQCIGFVPRATVQLTPDGIRFSVEESRVIQGLAFLDKALFTSYTFNAPATNNDEDDTADDNGSNTTYHPTFEISLAALLETLKIFTLNDQSSTGTAPIANRATSVQPPSSSAFNAPTLLLDRSCTLQYNTDGSPFTITLSETGVKTTCELTTYEPDTGPDNNAADMDIPLQRDAIIMKIIMRSAWLHNAITELAATTPSILKISAGAGSDNASSDESPYFTLSGSGGPFSESSVEFSVEQQGTGNNNTNTQSAPAASRKIPADDGSSRARTKRARPAPTVTETFLVSAPSSMGRHIEQKYRFSLIQKAARAMAVASKVSIRGDRQGVLSLQFMIDFDPASRVGGVSRPVGGAGSGAGAATGSSAVTFVDFRFVPLVEEDDGELEEGAGEEL